ncbi:paf acetylhydrolase family [Trichoderma arundinaceum]|uniref:1-alkyl-2-acetylglycerophosphocholine esterase n=1 Tax=Trichoderma arundinaceum TaxID=490622 RepID=A0A395NM92_TRIAR|nr:paf acetylhydrolase family [Trichoderma arundinaceum]
MRLLAPICLLLSVSRATLVPGPAGPYAVAMKEQPLTDTSRADPLDPTGKSKTRRLLVSLYLPVDKSRRSCPAVTVPYMTPPVAASYGQTATQVGIPDTFYEQFQMEFCDLKKLSPCGQASNKNRKYPLILFDPGLGESRLIYGAMARSLASHGYVVVTVDHPFDAPAVQFPDGTVIEGVDLDPSDPSVLPKVLKTRTDDIIFIINQLENKKIMKPLLADFPGTIDYSQLAIWGHSFGGATAASVIHADKRFLGGLDLDGMLVDPILSTNIAKPFVLAGRNGHDAEDPSWNQFWPHLKGKRIEIAIADTQHGAFKDDLMLLSTVTLPADIKKAIQEALGSIDPHQLDRDLNGILTAYFDLLFYGKKKPLQAIPREFANVTIVRSSL